MSPVMRLLKIEHNRLRKLFSILDEQVSHILAGEGGDFDIIEAVFSYCETYADRCHHPRENIVFRQLQLRGGDAECRIYDLLREHGELGEIGRKAGAALGDLRDDPAAALAWAKKDAAEYLRTNRSHLETEEKIFFPAAIKMLSDKDWVEIDLQIAASGNPDFGADTAKRFEYLLDYIANLDRLSHFSAAS